MSFSLINLLTRLHCEVTGIRLISPLCVFPSLCFAMLLKCKASYRSPPLGCQPLLRDAIRPVLFLSYPPSHPQVSSILCLRLIKKTQLTFMHISFLCFLITKCVSFLFFSPLSYVLLKISIHPARYISYPAFGLHAYVCLKQPLCLLHPLLNTHTPDIQSHAHSCNP